MPKAIHYATEAEAIAVLKRTGYSKASSGWQSPHNEMSAEIKSDESKSYYWIEFKANGIKFGPN